MSKYLTLALGDFFFGEHMDREYTTVYSVASITMEPSRGIHLKTEKAMAGGKGAESYIILENFDEKIRSRNEWWCYDEDGAVVAFDRKLRPICGFSTIDELAKEYPKAKPVGNLSRKFNWSRYNESQQG